MGDCHYTQILDYVHVPFSHAHYHVYGHIAIDFLNGFTKKVWRKRQQDIQSRNGLNKPPKKGKSNSTDATTGLEMGRTCEEEDLGEKRDFFIADFSLLWIEEAQQGTDLEGISDFSQQ